MTDAQQLTIDAHRHLPEGDELGELVGTILADMDVNDVHGCVLVPSHREIVTGTGNDRVLRAVDLAAGRLRAMAAVNPWHSDDAIEDLREAVARGAIGLKLHPSNQGYLACGALAERLVGEAVSLGVPIYVHTASPPFAQPLQVVELARRWPRGLFMLGHAGSTDLKRDALVAASMADNIVVETSWTLPMRLNELVKAWGPDRVVFGSDAPESVLSIEVANHAAANLEPAIATAVMGGNARRLLRWS